MNESAGSSTRILSLTALLGLCLTLALLLGLPRMSRAVAGQSGETSATAEERLAAAGLVTATSSYTYYFPLVFQGYTPTLWTYLGPEGVSIRTVAADPQIPGVLYVGTWDSGVYKTTDDGESWESVSQGLPVSASVREVVIDPLCSENVYVVTSQYPRTYASKDGGESWTPGGGLQMPAGMLTIDPVTPTTLYVGTGPFDRVPAGVHRSLDGGATWTNVSPSLYCGRYSLLALRSEPGTVYARGSVLHRSTDSGDSWQKLTDHELYDIVASPDDEQTIYSTNGFVTHDGGTSWEPMGTPNPGVGMYQIVVDSFLPHLLYASSWPYAGECRGVYVSFDSGQHWQPMNAGLGNLCAGDLALASDGAYLYADTKNGVWRYSLDAYHTQ